MSDFLPTVCDIIGTKPPQDHAVDGVSILPHLRGESESRTSPISWAFGINGNFNKKYNAAISDNRYNKLYVEYKRGKIRSSYLYDLQVDTSELNDVSSDHPEILDQLTTRLNVWDTSLESSARYQVGCMATTEWFHLQTIATWTLTSSIAYHSFFFKHLVIIPCLCYLAISESGWDQPCTQFLTFQLLPLALSMHITLFSLNSSSLSMLSISGSGWDQPCTQFLTFPTLWRAWVQGWSAIKRGILPSSARLQSWYMQFLT